MQDIYSHIAETNHVPTLYTVAAVLLLQYMAHVMLCPTIHPLYCAPVLSAVCAVLSVAFCAVPGHRAFPIRCSGTL